jgi:hypothetical protein
MVVPERVVHPHTSILRPKGAAESAGTDGTVACTVDFRFDACAPSVKSATLALSKPDLLNGPAEGKLKPTEVGSEQITPDHHLRIFEIELANQRVGTKV